MPIKSMRLENRNYLAAQYVKGKLHHFFSYHPYESLKDRVNHLQTRTFPRSELSSILIKMNKAWGASSETLRQIERLQHPESVVVVGGQQAGLLTGPLYTIHKIISIIKFANMQEEKLQIPVIPLFWIAGEDHDYDEINHIFTTPNNKLTKRKIAQEEWLKVPISDLHIEKTKAEQWMKQIFHDITETEHTKPLVEKLFTHLGKANTFVDFFARIVLDLFKEEGLVVIDSGNEDLRSIERDIFIQLIERQPEMTKAINSTAEKLHQAGYHLQVDVTPSDANLFYHDERNERILLMRDGNHWVGKHEEVKLTTEELRQIAREHPERLSNNVLSRPFMQESLLPTLSFIAGDGEISYWALLKHAFHAFDDDIKMPPVIPRLSITLINARLKKLIENRQLDERMIINNGCHQVRLNWLTAQQNPPVQVIFKEAERQLRQTHEPIQSLTEQVNPTLRNEAEKNLQQLLRTLQYLEQRTINEMEKKYAWELSQFKEVELGLRPREQLQERVLNILPFLNECGANIINAILQQPFSFKEDHYIVFLQDLT